MGDVYEWWQFARIELEIVQANQETRERVTDNGLAVLAAGLSDDRRLGGAVDALEIRSRATDDDGGTNTEASRSSILEIAMLLKGDSYVG